MKTSSSVRRGSSRFAGIVAVCVFLAGIAGSAVFSPPAAADAATVTGARLAAGLALTPSRAVMGQRVTASAAHSTLPKSKARARIVLTWGDGTKPVVLANLRSRPSHVYAGPGHFKVTVAITVGKAKVRTSKIETIIAPGGRYSALTPHYGSVTPFAFFVAAGGASLQDISIQGIALTCSPDIAPNLATDQLEIASVALRKNGSFTGIATQTGVVSGVPATFTYVFSGRFAGLDAGGQARAAGTFRDTVTYNDGVAHSCTSNNQSWTATRDVQPAQTTAAPSPGRYSALSPYYGSVSPFAFFVGAGGTELQDISIPWVPLTCSPDVAPNLTVDHLEIASVAITGNRSFNGSATQTGVVAGVTATFTYSFSGHFHAVGTGGVARAAGLFRETVAYDDGVAHTCTSNDQTWTATRDVQPTQTTASPAAGNYSGVSPHYGSALLLSFSVPPGGTALQEISIPYVALTCSPDVAPKLTVNHLEIASIAVAADQSFNGSAVQTGVVAGVPATFTYSFSGHFHAVGTGGLARAAGMFRETVAYNTGVAHMCTSNNQSWTASLTP